MTGAVVDTSGEAEAQSALLASLRDTIRSLSLHVSSAAQALDSASMALGAFERSLAAVDRQAASDLPHGFGLADDPQDDAPLAGVDDFRWESDAGGTICWVEGAPRGPFVGQQIGGAKDEATIAARRPSRGIRLTLPYDGPFGGEWRLCGLPFFEPHSGRFLGYRGTAARMAAAPTVSVPATADAASSDMVRQLLHEIRTPLNAILGFAEMIDGQHLGPASPTYRARAADIVARAAQVFKAVESLEAEARSEPACQTPRRSAIGAKPGEGL